MNKICVVCSAVSDYYLDGMHFCSACRNTDSTISSEFERTRAVARTCPIGVMGNIFIGDIDSVHNLRHCNIDGVVVCGRALIYKRDDAIEYLELDIDDSLEQDILHCLAKVTAFIHSKANVLVHCYSGISRSAALIVGHLMTSEGYTFDEALRFLKSKKANVHPNSNFVKQLRSLN
jgi:Dual specificity phosphatase, catalytic domain